MLTVPVALGERSYDIHIGGGLLARAETWLKPHIRRAPVFVLTDETVAATHLPTLMQALERAGIAAVPVLSAPGEGAKSFVNLERVTEAILAHQPERKSCLIALGGGVVGDLTGFVASLLLRGVDFIQIPTTLLAQVDSSVGGKTAINSRHGKNLIGTFYQPRLVLADTGVLRTLPKREVLAGYAEILKYGLLGDVPFFEWLQTNGQAVVNLEPAAIAEAVAKSCHAKAAIVAQDEREAGVRELLNLGHTFGHALEAATGFSDALLHGESVALGMLMALRLSVALGLCPAEAETTTLAHYRAVGLPVAMPHLPAEWDAEALYTAMRGDKKVTDGAIRFILMRGIGQAFGTVDVPRPAVLEILNAFLQEAKRAAP